MEGAVLTAFGVAVGMWGGAVAGPWIGNLFVGEAVVRASSVLSPTVLGFLAAAGLGAWVVMSGVPVLHFLRAQRAGLALNPRSGARLQRSLVAVQASLATLLLVSATLLVGTVRNLRAVPLGFEPKDLLAVELSPPEDRIADPATARTLYDGLVEKVGAVPGVTAVGLTARIPLRGAQTRAPLNLQSAPVDQVQAQQADYHVVDPGYFRVMGIEPLQGRLLDSRERQPGISAVVINESLARRLWPDASPIGRRIAIDPHMWSTFLPIVGVVPDLRTADLTAPPGPAIYVSLAESPFREVALMVRTAPGAAAVLPAVSRAVADVDAQVPIRSIMWMDDVIRAAYSISWVVMGLLVALAALATGLGAVGIYAALSQHVASTRREIGVRMALGADPAKVVGSVVRSGVLVAGVGVAVGSIAAALSARVLESMLFGVSTLSPWAYLAPALGVCLAAAVAGWLPAARAGRLPPAEVLRSE